MVEEIAGTKKYRINSFRAFGGGQAIRRRWDEIKVGRVPLDTDYYVLIYESGNDQRVLVDVRDQYPTLLHSGFDSIIGLRDLFPFGLVDAPKVRRNWGDYVPPGRLIPELILAILELEAWFIGEHTHFERISLKLTAPAVRGILGYDPATVNPESIAHPSAELRSVYSSVGAGYNKSIEHAERTLSALSFEELYLSVRPRIPDLDRLFKLLDNFFLQN